MTSRRRALGAGAAVAAAYLALATWSGSLSVLARRPLLDGLSPPPPYRWVKPPPALAAGNEKPLSGSARVKVGPKGAQAGVFSTADQQANLILPPNVVPASPGQTALSIRLVPLLPPAAPKVPKGLQIVGNVYRISATFVPSGKSPTSLRDHPEVALVYPAGPLVNHTLLQSSDLKRWTAIHTIDNAQLLQVTAGIHTLGYFAVAQPASAPAITSTPTSPSPPAPGGGSSPIETIIIVSAIALALLLIALRWLHPRRGDNRRAGRR